MAIRVEDVGNITWLWHDASIYYLRVDLSDAGEASICMRCEIHPDEDRRTLFDLGILTPVVDVQFRDAREVKLNLHADTSSREWVDRWEVSPSLSGNRARHHMSGSIGSTLDVKCAEVWIGAVMP